jgi:hypothetical protein
MGCENKSSALRLLGNGSIADRNYRLRRTRIG